MDTLVRYKSITKSFQAHNYSLLLRSISLPLLTAKSQQRLLGIFRNLDPVTKNPFSQPKPLIYPCSNTKRCRHYYPFNRRFENYTNANVKFVLILQMDKTKILIWKFKSIPMTGAQKRIRRITHLTHKSLNLILNFLMMLS